MNFEEFEGAFVATQAMAFTNRFVLQEVIEALALQTPDPDAFLAAMFERVMRRTEAISAGEETRPVLAEMHESVTRLFSNARLSLDRKGQSSQDV